MRRLLPYLWTIPMIVLVAIYASEAFGVFMGNTEHFNLLSGVGLSGNSTTLLVWLSVIIEVVVIAAVVIRPSSLTFSIAALWPWVPRVLGSLTGVPMEMMEMDMSLAATIAAMCAYMAYGHGHYPRLRAPAAAIS